MIDIWWLNNYHQFQILGLSGNIVHWQGDLKKDDKGNNAYVVSLVIPTDIGMTVGIHLYFKAVTFFRLLAHKCYLSISYAFLIAELPHSYNRSS